jgi:hypothetical protein
LGGDYGSTAQGVAVLKELSGELSVQLADLARILNAGLPAFNAQLKAAGIAPVNTSRTVSGDAAGSN